MGTQVPLDIARRLDTVNEPRQAAARQRDVFGQLAHPQTVVGRIFQDQQHIIEVCAVRDDAAGGYQSVRYVYGTETAADLSFPADRRDGKAVLRFAHYFDKNVYNWSLRFDNKAYGYRVTSAGVEVSKKKKVIATVLCGGKPVMYPGDIRRATSCDSSAINARLQQRSANASAVPTVKVCAFSADGARVCQMTCTLTGR